MFLSKKKKPKRVIILGSGGFISSHLENILKIKNINFKGLTRKDVDLSNNVSVKKLKKMIKPFDTIVIIAAKAPCKNIEMFDNNIRIINNICSGLQNKKLEQVIYISSDAVYSDSFKKLNEKSETNPNNYHGLMHLCREKILSLNFNKKLCILRPTLIYGNNDPHNGYGPNSFLRLAKKNLPIKLYGKGEELRDHINVDIVAGVIFKCIIYKYVGILNLVTGSKISFLEIAKLAIKNTKSKSKIIFIKRKGPMPHNGYRLFNTNLLNKTFKNINLKSINKNKSYR